MHFVSVSDPFFEYTLLNESKMKYTPDSKYTEAKIISPGYYPYPSVAHILSESMSESSEMHLKRWKDNLVTELGEQEFQVHSECKVHKLFFIFYLFVLQIVFCFTNCNLLQH